MATDNNGWTIEKQYKAYGPYVEVTLNGKLEVKLNANPIGLKLEQLPAKLDCIAPTRANADKLGFQLQRLFEDVEALMKPAALFELPIEPIEEMEPTVISPSHRDPSSPFST